jgi:predicted CoA-binding protein
MNVLKRNTKGFADLLEVIRFGGINTRKADPLYIVHQSLLDTGWEVQYIEPAGSASSGRRQALHMSNVNEPKEEYDIWARKC